MSTLLTETAPAAENPEVTPATQNAAPIINTNPDVNWTTAIDAEGNFNEAAHGYGLPEHIKSVGGMLKSYQDMQRMKGSPGAEASPEQIKAFREAQGVPEVVNAEAYGIQLPDELKDVYATESLDRIAKAANENAHLGHTGMIQAIVSEFAAMEIDGMAANQQASEKQAAEALAEKAKQLDSDPNFTGAGRTGAIQTAANALNNALDNLGVNKDSPEAQEVANSPLMVRILHHYGSKTSQDNTNLGASNTDLRSKVDIANDIMKNSSNPENAAYLAGDKIVGNKVLKLMGAI